MRKILIVLPLFLSSLALSAPTFEQWLGLEVASECNMPRGQCPGVGWFCLNGRCVQERTGERCWVNTDCAIGARCVDGVCR